VARQKIMAARDAEWYGAAVKLEEFREKVSRSLRARPKNVKQLQISEVPLALAFLTY
jgi:hypothetical protein